MSNHTAIHTDNTTPGTPTYNDARTTDMHWVECSCGWGKGDGFHYTVEDAEAAYARHITDNTRTIEGTTYHVVTNGHTRPIVELVFDDNDGWRVPTEDEYLGGKSLSSGFVYRGECYALSEFDRAGAHMIELGYDGFQSSSYWDGIAVRYARDEYTDGIDYDNGIVVAHIHW